MIVYVCASRWQHEVIFHHTAYISQIEAAVFCNSENEKHAGEAGFVRCDFTRMDVKE